jgi:hypothetical protein
MKIFGRKVRRLGLMLALAGATMIGWHFSQDADGSAATDVQPNVAPTQP